MMRLIFVLLLVLAAAVPLSSVFAQSGAVRSEGIAVVVNDGLISYSDVMNRVKLIMESSGLPDTKETQERLLPQIVRSLIEEELQLQEGRRLKIEVSEDEVQKAMAEIAQSNNMSASDFREMMERRNVSIDSLYRQLRAQLVWRKVFAASLVQNIRISDTDVEAHIERLRNQTGRREYLLAEIFLPVEAGDEEGNVRQLASRVVSDLRTQKAQFSAVAQQISRSAGAAQGGMMGWVQADQLDSNIANAVRVMEVKTISDPVRSLAGYHILYLANARVVSEESVPTPEAARERIFAERADRAARSRLSELRSSAFIEIRL